MAMIRCPECGKQDVSSTATLCPNCGFNIKRYIKKYRKRKNRKFIGVIVLIVGLLIVVLTCLLIYKLCIEDKSHTLNKRTQDEIENILGGDESLNRLEMQYSEGLNECQKGNYYHAKDIFETIEFYKESDSYYKWLENYIEKSDTYIDEAESVIDGVISDDKIYVYDACDKINLLPNDHPRKEELYDFYVKIADFCGKYYAQDGNHIFTINCCELKNGVAYYNLGNKWIDIFLAYNIKDWPEDAYIPKSYMSASLAGATSLGWGYVSENANGKREYLGNMYDEKMFDIDGNRLIMTDEETGKEYIFTKKGEGYIPKTHDWNIPKQEMSLSENIYEMYYTPSELCGFLGRYYDELVHAYDNAKKHNL